MIPFSRPTLDVEEMGAVCDVIGSGWLAPGEQVNKFQREFSEYVGIKHCFFTNSGTSALKMAYKYMKEVRGHNSFSCPQNTYPASWMAGFEMGLERIVSRVPIGDILSVAVAYGGKPIVHPCDIEDSAHRIERNDKLVHGDIRIYSFYATKNMTTGSGGMVCTDSDYIAEFLKLYLNDGLDKGTGLDHYEIVTEAGGYDGNDILASIGRVQLEKLDGFTERRNWIVSEYNREFGQGWTGNHLYPVFVGRPLDVKPAREYLYKNGIKTGYHYPFSGWRGISLPLCPNLQDDDVDYIIKVVKDCPYIKPQYWSLEKLVKELPYGTSPM